jgi:hypothetical protein
VMPDEHAAEIGTSDYERDELVGLVGNAYVRRGLSPPSQLHGAVGRWLGLSRREILDGLDRHFAERRRYRTTEMGTESGIRAAILPSGRERFAWLRNEPDMRYFVRRSPLVNSGVLLMWRRLCRHLQHTSWYRHCGAAR